MSEPYASLGKILVIIPTYNEVQNIEPITRRIRASVPDAHILVADDNSPDGTGEVADRLAAADEHIHVLHRHGKEGLAAAYIAGFRYGLENGYHVLVEHDADGSHRPEELPKLLNALTKADMVKGSRWVKGGKVVNYSKFREYLSRGGSLYTNFWLGLGVKDPSGGFNLFRSYVLEDILDDVAVKGYLFQTELTFLAKQKGYKVVEVPIEFPDRTAGESKLNKQIFIESLLETTKRGLKLRSAQAVELSGDVAKLGGKLLHKVGKGAAQLTGKQLDASKCPYAKHHAQESAKRQSPVAGSAKDDDSE